MGIGLAQAGKKVLLIDGDPQGSLTISLGNPQPDKLPFTLSDTMGHILIDCQPSLGMLTVNALAAANRIIIPVQAEYLPAKGLEQLLSTVSKVKRQINPKLQIDGILLPSERAFAYKMKLEAIKHQGERSDLTSRQVGEKSQTSIQLVANQTGESQRQVQRFIRLTELIPELLDMVDEKKIA